MMPDLALDLPGPPAANRVVVAMSGGVDSSVVAGLLHRAGYDVVGITLRLYDHGAAVHRAGACCAGQDVHDARRVAELLGIPHYVLDYEERFRAAVIDRFSQAYVAGETPLPCADCNQRVKFTDLLTTALDLGAVAMATGHYVASRAVPEGRGLFRARETQRDQSYFLYGTTQEQLRSLRFPLGDLTKAQTRSIARELGLSVADKPDSQDICFVPTGRYTDIVERLKPEAAAAGEIVHLDGRVLGRHPGVSHFTVGQRRGLRVATGEPLFVVRLDADRHQVIVGPREALMARIMELRQVNWIGGGRLTEGRCVPVFVKVRSMRQPVPAELQVSEGIVRITLVDPEEGVSPGQACVFYDSGLPQARLLGGGTIVSTERSAAVPIPRPVGEFVL